MHAHSLPDFIVIGAMKSGTTSLHYYCDSHKEISMAPKEINFFNENFNWKKWIDWYKKQFKKNDCIKGEVSPSYSKFHLYKNVEL